MNSVLQADQSLDVVFVYVHLYTCIFVCVFDLKDSECTGKLGAAG